MTTDELIDRVGREHVRGRRLMVGTANLDAERMVIWNILAKAPARTGRIAAQPVGNQCMETVASADG